METVETTAIRTLLTPEEYLARERKALTKSEYRDGRIHALPGASRKHNLIAVHVTGELYIQLRTRSCEVYTNDMRVKVSAAGLYTYPDVVIVCDEPRFEDSHFDTLLNPTVLIEVLSPSTAAYDRGEKFASYQKLDSLCEYVLISQDSVCVEHYLRQAQDWNLTEFRSLDDVFSLVSIACELSLQAIYAKVQFSQE
ncbi:Uma2 family endonuclease [Candidatus Poribacteria bacterium]|nr:Uma2 family endonuclease [Candidatus Poribacteria bacterium]MYB01341.1 Uma2 family endonuclease [Candidatus Poribacteria bacterium]